MQYDADGSVRLHTTSPEAPAGPVLAQYPGHDGTARCCKALTIAAGGAAPAPQAVSDPLTSKQVWTYRAEAPSLPRRPAPFVGGAVYGRDAKVLRQRSPSELRSGRTGEASAVIACATREGFHVLTTRSGVATGHLYLSFDYEVKPTCSREQVRLLSKE